MRQIPKPNREIIERVARNSTLNDDQKVILEEFARVDDEWRTLAAVGNRYQGMESRLEEISGRRLGLLGNEKDPVLRKALGDYERQVDEAVLEDGLNLLV